MALSKADLLPPEERPRAAERAELPQAHVVSAHSGEGVRSLLEDLWGLLAVAAVAAPEGDHDGAE